MIKIWRWLFGMFAATFLSVSALAEPIFTGGRGLSIPRPFLTDAPKPADIANPTVGFAPFRQFNAPEALTRLRGAGFDLVRIPLDPTALLVRDAAGRTPIYAELDSAVAALNTAGFSVIVDLHVRESQGPWTSTRLRAGAADPADWAHFKSRVAEAAAWVSRFPPERVALELFNEPLCPAAGASPAVWPAMARELFAAARARAPRHTLIVSGACWAKLEGLMQLDAQKFDANTIFSFHYYAPHIFTHQGAWTGNDVVQHVTRLPWPAPRANVEAVTRAANAALEANQKLDSAEKTRRRAKIAKEVAAYARAGHDEGRIAADFAQVAAWARREGVAPGQILLGEFGVQRDIYGYRGAALADRAAWMGAVRQEAEAAGFRWSVWALTGPMGLVAGENEGEPEPLLLDALGLLVSGR